MQQYIKLVNSKQQQIVNYREARVKLTNRQLNRLKSASKNKAGTIFRFNKRNFEDEELPHEFFLTTRQTTKLRNVFANNVSTDKKISKTQILGRSFGSWLSNLAKKALRDIAITLDRDNLFGLVGNLTSNAINKVESKIIGKGAVRAGKGFTLKI